MFDGEEVTGQYGSSLSAQESLPAQARSPRRWRHPVAAQDAPNGRCGDLLPELAQFALDAAIAPARVLACQTQDQLLALARQRRSTKSAARAAPEGSPFAADQLPMPTEDGLRAEPGRRPRLVAAADG